MSASPSVKYQDIIIEDTDRYSIGERRYNDGIAQSITCKECNLTSWHPEDVKHKYCGHCHKFH